MLVVDRLDQRHLAVELSTEFEHLYHLRNAAKRILSMCESCNRYDFVEHTVAERQFLGLPSMSMVC